LYRTARQAIQRCRPEWLGAGAAIGQAAVIVFSLYVFLRGWTRDLDVPFQFFFDGLFYLAQAKSTIDNGWWWFNPMLGAPFGLDELAFPANGNVDQAIVWAVSVIVPDTFRAVNVAWASMVVVSGLAATWAMRTLNVSLPSAVVAGTLFALSPYALYKNLGHFGMAIYLVPFACAAALQLASGQLPERGYVKGVGLVLVIGCALLSFNYIYYPFFACFLVGVATIIGSVAERQWRILRAGSLILSVLVGCTAINLAPSLYSWSQHGKPVIMVEKSPAHSEVYGLKIRTLVSPVIHHWFPPFRKWIESESTAQFPLQTENTVSRLGLVGTLGFLGLLAFLFLPAAAGRSAARRTLLSGSQLTIAAVLLATIGGFGSLFSLLISPDIRAYSRIAPFIEFMALAAVAIAMDSMFRSRRKRIGAAVIVLMLGLADQRGAAADMNIDYPNINAEVQSLGSFVRRLEDRLPDGAMVFQLPLRTYLNEGAGARMGPYDHFKMYLLSDNLRWSYPALSNAQVTWQAAAGSLDPERLPYQLAHEGFAAVVIDRYGYEDNGSAIIASIRTPLTSLGGSEVIAETDRYLALDIRSLPGAHDDVISSLPTRPTAATQTMTGCGGAPLMSIDRLGVIVAPSGTGPFRIRQASGLKIVGWAVDQSRGVSAAGVDVVVDGSLLPSVYGWERPDVAEHFGVPAYRHSGFVAEVPGDQLGNGQHTISLRVVSSARDCYYERPGISLIVE
jgi:phosphoglycerol transferase